MTLDDGQIVWLGLVSVEADGRVHCSNLSVSSLLGLSGTRSRLEEFAALLERQGLRNGLDQLRRQGSLAIDWTDTGRSGAPQRVILRRLPDPGPAENFLVG